MKKIKLFLLKTSYLLITILLIISSLFFVRYFTTKSISWKLPKDKKTLFMGASHIEKGINPKYYPSSVNLAAGSERYMFTYIKLKKLLEQNNQLDTLFLQFAPTDIQVNTDSKYFSPNEMSRYLPLYSPLFSLEQWKIYSNNKITALTLLTQKILKKIPTNINKFGGYKPSFGVFIEKDKEYKMPVWSESGHDINYKYLNKIINLCVQRNIKVIFIYMPMYNKSSFYNTDYFYNIYKNKFSDIEFLDYSEWKCPNDYRNDEHHLNNIGAINFTKKLKKDLLVKIRD